MASSGELAIFKNNLLVNLIPEAEKVALHFEISHLYVAKHPKLEGIVRLRASASQLLFNSSSNLLLQCALTSKSIVTSLFPILRLAAEHNDNKLASRAFHKTREWIREIHTAAVDLKDKFSSLHAEVNSDCSLVLLTETEDKNQSEQLKNEIKVHQGRIDSLNGSKDKIKAEIDQIQGKITELEKRQQDLMDEIKKRDRKFAISTAAIPIIGGFICAIHGMIASPVDIKKLKQFEQQMDRLWLQKREKEKVKENLELEIFEEQMKFVTIQTNAGILVSDAENLKYVENHLCKAQEILVKIINFWEQAGITIKTMEKTTETPELLMEDLEKYKVHFLKSLKSAEKVWENFSSYCLKFKTDYDRQSKDFYQFLAVNPCNLSQEDWKKRITDANEKLRNYCKASSGESIGDVPSARALPENI